MRILFFMAFILAGFAAEASPQQSTLATINSAPNPAFALVKPGEWVLGNPNAAVTVTEYASMSCTHCADFHREVFPKIQQEYIATNKIKFVFRDFPLNAPALRGAMLLRCSPEEKRKTMLEKLFASQKSWAFDRDFETHLQTIALEQGLSKRSFRRCMADSDLEKSVVQSRMDGAKQLGINGTPTVFVNGERFNGKPDYAGLKALIDKYLLVAQ